MSGTVIGVEIFFPRQRSRLFRHPCRKLGTILILERGFHKWKPISCVSLIPEAFNSRLIRPLLRLPDPAPPNNGMEILN